MSVAQTFHQSIKSCQDFQLKYFVGKFQTKVKITEKEYISSISARTGKKSDQF